MNEDFLQYVWKFQQFNTIELHTTDGEAIDVVHPGRHNRDAGPDFLDAKVRIGGTLWAGNVEIHITAGDWEKHRHHLDHAYDNVVLHVVYSADKEVYTSAQQPLPTLCIRDKFDFQVYRYYRSWLISSKYIPCEGLTKHVPSIIKTNAVQQASIARIEAKSHICLDHLTETKGDVEGSFYRILMRSFGFKVNALPMEQFSRLVPIALVRKVRQDPEDLCALFLGQAGLLDDSKGEHSYISDHKRRYAFLKAKFNLEPMPASAWKLMRLRPQNFPAVRLAQAARLYALHESLSQAVITLELEQLIELFSVALQDPFWDSHFTLSKPSPKGVKKVGKDTALLLIINAVVPFLFAMGGYNKAESFRKKAVDLLESIEPETNAVVKRFTGLGFYASSAFDSQGVLHLKQQWCEKKNCLNCKVGIYLLKNYDFARNADFQFL